MEEKKACLRQNVFNAARDGNVTELRNLLTSKQDFVFYDLEILNSWTEDQGQNCTPLIIAAKNGHDKVVTLLLTQFETPIEQQGTVNFAGVVIEGATALWCAASGGHLSVVKTLVNYGAVVNHTTRDHKTTLVAVNNGRYLERVMNLVEHTPDFSITTLVSATCLMFSAGKGRVDIVNYLIENGANLDCKDKNGNTALHYAAKEGHLEMMKLLIERGAEILTNDQGLLPLLSAATLSRADIVDYCVAQPWCSREDKVTALELLGATFANKKVNNDLGKCFYYLEKAMEERFEDGKEVLRKSLNCPIAAYEDKLECQNLEELRAIEKDANALHMQSLIILERILGFSSHILPFHILYRGSILAASGRYDRCLQLWRHALSLLGVIREDYQKHFLRSVRLFCGMILTRAKLSFEDVGFLFEVLIELIQRDKLKLEGCLPESEARLQDELEKNIPLAMYLLVIVTKVLKDETTEDQEHKVKQCIYNLNQMKMVTKDGSSLLHLALDAKTKFNSFFPQSIRKFPYVATVELLIQCGADVNLPDGNRNTPLHVISSQPDAGYSTLQTIIVSLIEAGAHFDTENNEGETPSDCAATEDAKTILRSQKKLSLKCLAVKAVKKFNIAYLPSVPPHLVRFIEMH